MKKRISVIIPNYNGSATIGRCLESVFSSRHEDFEVIVVDDCSEDNSVEVISRFPSRLIRLEKHSGAAHARNVGAYNSKYEMLFFTDADCIMMEDTLLKASEFVGDKGAWVIGGGTYTKEPADNNFFSRFQSVFINHFETKHANNPDYVATHAMFMHAETFRDSGGFTEWSLPILEDVEFSHRMRGKGCKLFISPDILVRHIFNYTFARSFANAFRKSMYWTIYSLRKRDVFADSGTASHELKANVVLFFVSLLLLAASVISRAFALHSLLPAVLLINIAVNRRLVIAFYKTGGVWFGLAASFYYFFVYPPAVGSGVIAGVIRRLVI